MTKREFIVNAIRRMDVAADVTGTPRELSLRALKMRGIQSSRVDGAAIVDQSDAYVVERAVVELGGADLKFDAEEDDGDEEGEDEDEESDETSGEHAPVAAFGGNRAALRSLEDKKKKKK